MTKKTWSPTVRHALKKARSDMDGPADVVAVPGEREAKGESTAHQEQPEPMATSGDPSGQDDTVTVGKKKKRAPSDDGDHEYR